MMHYFLLYLVFGALVTPQIRAVPYSEFILAPASRLVNPVSVHRINGTVTGATSLLGNSTGSAVFKGPSSVTYDYMKNIAGVVSVTVGGSSSPDALIGLTYSESAVWINGRGSDATADAGLDEVLVRLFVRPMYHIFGGCQSFPQFEFKRSSTSIDSC